MRINLGWAAVAVMASACGGPANETTATRTSSTTMAAGTAAAPGASSAPGTGGIVGATSGEFAAEVVAVDATARTVTLRESAVGGTAATTGTSGTATTGSTAPGGTTTVRVDGTAGDTLRDYKTGDRVVVSCTMGGTPMGTASPGASPAATGSVLSGCSTVTAIRKAS